MAVRIRLRRIGKKKEVHYRVVVAEARTSREGRFIETIGYVNPRVDPPEVRLDADRARVWLKRGARPTDTVKSILIREGIWQKIEPAHKGKESETREGKDAPPRGEVSADAGTDRNDSESPG
ncbi:MAG: 30S ribosomal protein S16 [Armatimonadetes bacterium]|nr:30S ribosomal protein S16 [Armatimonadota bacterium]NIO76147.1 30S ribosomal protein S16 [Armatimonadota bacterium]NIO98843.1 30S ribosomal protein S16 [Armatimonadota bacterium]